MEAFTDYYTVLGVDAHAPADTIKAAFKKLALQYHPDIYKGEDAEERMRLLLLAYQTLSDPASRRNYDVLRAERLDIGVNGTARSHSYTTTGAPVKKNHRVGGGEHVAVDEAPQPDDAHVEMCLVQSDELLIGAVGRAIVDENDLPVDIERCQCHVELVAGVPVEALHELGPVEGWGAGCGLA